MGEVKPVAIVNRIEMLITESDEIKSIYSLAKQCGISDQTILDWRNKNRSPTIDKLSKVAEVLGVSIDWLVYGSNYTSEGQDMNGAEIVERIKSKMELKEVSRLTGISQQTISHWKTRGTIPSAKYIENIAAVLNVSSQWLLSGISPNGEALSEEHQELCRLYDAAEDDARHYALVILRDSAERKKGFPQRACAGQDGR